MGRVQHFQQLETWQESHKLELMVYRATKEFPSDERYGLISQMRRAAVSIPANVAEGFKLDQRDDPDGQAGVSIPANVAEGFKRRVGRLLHGLIASTERRR